MALFTYTATNDDNKEVVGSLESADEASARRAVEDLHLEVKELREASRTKPAAAQASPGGQPQSFAFEGTDAAGTVRRGTLQAPTKRDAFAHLRDDQKLTLRMLSPVGVLPQYKDPDLEQWQGKTGPAPSPVASVPKRPIGFTGVGAASIPQPKVPAASEPASAGAYMPLTSTLRLYAGWLLAWYGLFVALGYYATVRSLPWEIPFVQAFYVSPLIFSFVVAIFLFLLLSTVHRMTKGRLISGLLLTVIGIGMFVGIRMIS